MSPWVSDARDGPSTDDGRPVPPDRGDIAITSADWEQVSRVTHLSFGDNDDRVHSDRIFVDDH